MKKVSLIISFVLLFALGGNAQSGSLRYGVKLGPSFGWASAGSVVTSNQGMRLGVNAGVVVDYGFTDHVWLSSGLNVNFLRMKYEFADMRLMEGFLQPTQVAVTRRVMSTNLEVPVKAKVRFGIVDAFMGYVEAGVGLGFNLKDVCKDVYEFYGVSFREDVYSNRTEQYRPVQLSLDFGVGAEYEVNSNWSLFAQLTFEHGMLNSFARNLAEKTGSIIRPNFIGVEVGLLH